MMNINFVASFIEMPQYRVTRNNVITDGQRPDGRKSCLRREFFTEQIYKWCRCKTKLIVT